MSQVQHLLSVQFSFLSAEPERHESVTTPGGSEKKTQKLVLIHRCFFFHPCFSPAVGHIPGVTEKPVILTFLPPHQPLPERGVVEHPAAIIPPQQKRRQLLQAVHKL